MAIRISDLDLNTDGMKRHHQFNLGDRGSATAVTVPLFVAPIACRLDYVDVYAANGHAAQSASSHVTWRIHLATNSDTLLATRGGSSTDASDAFSANARYRITMTANNSLSTGTPISIQVSCANSGNVSNSIVHVIYTPLLHKETK